MHYNNSTKNDLIINNYSLFFTIILAFTIIISFQIIVFCYMIFYLNICKRVKRKYFSIQIGELNHSLDDEELNRLNELSSN